MAGPKEAGIDMEFVTELARAIERAKQKRPELEITIVVGGGNFWRGRDGGPLERSTSDYMGMLGTVMNALALQGALEHVGIFTRVQTSIEMREVAEPYIRRRAIRHLEKGRIVIFAAGTGNPYFSTDTTAALRAAEIGADCILIAKKGVDGIYSADPKIDPTAERFDTLTYRGILARDLKVLDSTATALCMENQIPLYVFGIDDTENITRALNGEPIGTLVKEDENA